MRAIVVFWALLVVLAPTPSRAEGFPLRAEYPDVQSISTDELFSEFDDLLLVDARSELEFDVIHMQGAVHNPVAQSMFRSRMFEITGSNMNAKLVFYCNGHSCAKSYQAARLAEEFGFRAVRAYDAGIFDWTRAHPEKAVLLGQWPADPAKLIPEEEFGRHLLEPDEFTKRAGEEDAYLIDLREPMQQGRTPDFGDKRVAKNYMAKLAERLPTDGFRTQTMGKTLYIFDAAGKQVRWLQYHLERHGYSDYYFLKGGTFNFFGLAAAH